MLAPRGGASAGAAVGDLGFAPGQVLDGPRDLGLRASVVGRRVHYLASVDSTNAALRALADAGEPEGTVLLADGQTAGRGRAGRAWFSPPGLGLWLSVLLRPGRPPREMGALSVATALSVAGALRESCGIDARVKWPNDVVAGGGRKLGGILLESLQGAGGSVERLVVGIGLNVNIGTGDLPPELAASAVSLRMLLGRPVSRLDVLRAVLSGFDADWRLFEADGLGGFRSRWLDLSTTLGRRVEIARDAGTVRGVAVGLSDAGALIVETDEGERREIWHGDVTAQGGPDD
jgi:BirA family biotin operon repressor/biotin-[acetyl-CoA-carboxylase] ligase